MGDRLLGKKSCARGKRRRVPEAGATAQACLGTWVSDSNKPYIHHTIAHNNFFCTINYVQILKFNWELEFSHYLI